MSEILLDTIDFYARINPAVQDAGGAAAFARSHNLGEQCVRDAVNMKSIHEAVPRAIGLLMVLRYPVRGQQKTLVSSKAVQEKLSSFIRECKTQRAAALHFGVHETTISKIQNAERGFGPVLAKLGFYAPVVRFIEMKNP